MHQHQTAGSKNLRFLRGQTRGRFRYKKILLLQNGDIKDGINTWESYDNKYSTRQQLQKNAKGAKTENRYIPLVNKRTTDTRPEKTDRHNKCGDKRHAVMECVQSKLCSRRNKLRLLQWLSSACTCTVHAGNVEQNNGGNCFKLAIFRISQSNYFLTKSHEEFILFQKCTNYFIVFSIVVSFFTSSPITTVRPRPSVS